MRYDDSSTFRDPRWLHQHVTNLLQYQYPRVIDDTYGGYIAQLSDVDGTIYDSRAKLLPATCRFVYNFCVGDHLGGPTWCREAARHGLDFLLDAHRDAESGGFAWVLDGRDVADDTRSTYGHAFVLLALSTAARREIPGAAEHVDDVVDLVDEHFWEAEHGLFRSDLDADWQEKSGYRGQNANMHMCEAFLAAYETTGDEGHLNRAYTIAESLARDLADEGDGLLWEHYTEDWRLDWEYNRDKPDDLFRPWGYQPGHLLEWAKLLSLIARERDDEWLLPRARRFFDAAVENGWDDEHGGFVYNFDRDGESIVHDKYYWPLAEGIGATTLLAEATGEDEYVDWYERIWEYAWENVVNQRTGDWYFRLTRDGQVHEAIDDTPEVKVGYHQISACYEVLRTMDAV